MNGQFFTSKDDWVYASPVIDSNGTIYIATGRGTVYAVSSTGSLRWSSRPGRGAGVITSTPALGRARHKLLQMCLINCYHIENTLFF
jgi:outer membrane protein assembly factor BamB